MIAQRNEKLLEQPTVSQHRASGREALHRTVENLKLLFGERPGSVGILPMSGCEGIDRVKYLCSTRLLSQDGLKFLNTRGEYAPVLIRHGSSRLHQFDEAFIIGVQASQEDIKQ